jgi:hypothetical protein
MRTSAMLFSLTIVLAWPSVASAQGLPRVSPPGALMVSPPSSTVVVRQSPLQRVQPPVSAPQRGVSRSLLRIGNDLRATSHTIVHQPFRMDARSVRVEARERHEVRIGASSIGNNRTASPTVPQISGGIETSSATRPTSAGREGAFGIRVLTPLGEIARQLRESR